MAASLVFRQERKIDCEEDVVLVRREVRALAEKHGFDAFAVAALTSAVSEFARNIWRHAGKGTAIVSELREPTRSGISVKFRDEGPGIQDVKEAVEGGQDTFRSLGLGLSGSRRLVDEFEIDSAVGRGTVVTIVKWRRR
jgi:serine/threonine-protein kinase RsbT